MVTLDATAGNRMMWPNKNPPLTVFIDKELKLARPPDVFADHRFCPFRDGVFDCVIYDPPFAVNIAPWFLNPAFDRRRGKDSIPSFFGNVKSKVELFRLVHDAQNEFKRLTNRLCLKWAETSVSLWKILPFFRGWTVIQSMKLKSRKTKNSWCPTGKHLYWVTFVRQPSARVAI